MSTIRSDVPAPHGGSDTGDDKHASTVEMLIERERARHASELLQTRDQIGALLTLPPQSLVLALDDDLAAIAIATVEAMSALRRTATSNSNGVAASEVGPSMRAAANHLDRIARLTRSVLALRLTLEVRMGPS